LFKTNPDFLNKKALVCDNCFLRLTQKSKAIGAVIPEVMNFNGTGKLDPLKLNRRRFITDIGKMSVE
jgi:hypothetical protein